MGSTPYRYTSADEDSGRWIDFPFRDGDIVISTRSKSGTTWMQTICALLVFQTPDLPAPVSELSPWVDWLITPRDQLLASLESQQHRRFVKTHTPLDGVVLDARATYIVVARHPLDMAVSLYHQGDNIDRAAMERMLGKEPGSLERRTPRPALPEWLASWADSEADPHEEMDSLPGVIHHLSDAWMRRDQPNIVLVHFDDLLADLDGEMRALAETLGIAVPEEVWPALVDRVRFASMRAHADDGTPTPDGVLKDRKAFFRSGTSGQGKAVLPVSPYQRFADRVRAQTPEGLADWLLRDS